MPCSCPLITHRALRPAFVNHVKFNLSPLRRATSRKCDTNTARLPTPLLKQDTCNGSQHYLLLQHQERLKDQSTIMWESSITTMATYAPLNDGNSQ